MCSATLLVAILRQVRVKWEKCEGHWKCTGNYCYVFQSQVTINILNTASHCCVKNYALHIVVRGLEL